MRLPIGLAFATALATFASPAAAQVRIELGVLDCRGTSSSYVLTGVQNMACTFRSTAGGAYRYNASIQRIGVDIGTNQQVAMSWIVFALTAQAPRNSIAGNYIGASANAALGIGGGANALVGGLNGAFMLQPVSVQGQTGVGVTATVSGLTLAPARR